MKKSNFIFVFVTVILFSSGCGTQKMLTKARKSGIELNYSFPAEKLNYKQNQDVMQEIDAFGQIINIDIDQSSDVFISKSSKVDNNSEINVKVNSVKMDINAMGQQMNPDLSDLNGKDFHMVVSPKGKEVDTHEADEIIFEVTPDERSNFGMIFNSFFPDLPKGIVKIGDTWESSDTLSFKDGEIYTTIISNSISTLNDFIEMDGRNCVEINSVFEGTMKGKSFSQGMELLIDTKLTGNGISYFDFENGVLLQDNIDGKAVGKIEMSQGEMDLTRDFKNITQLVKQ